MTRIVTTYTSRKSDGKSIIIAKGGGRQKTTGYDPALSVVENHGAAAGNLAAVLDDGRNFLGPTTVLVEVDNGRCTFDTNV